VRFLLDENVPVQLLAALRCILPAHDVDHVDILGWKGKQDRFLLPDAAAARYEALITIDRRQLDDPTELRAIRSSGLTTSPSPKAKESQDSPGPSPRSSPPCPPSRPSSTPPTASVSSASAGWQEPGATR